MINYDAIKTMNPPILLKNSKNRVLCHFSDRNIPSPILSFMQIMYSNLCKLCTQLYANYVLKCMQIMYSNVCILCTQMYANYVLKCMQIMYSNVCKLCTQMYANYVLKSIQIIKMAPTVLMFSHFPEKQDIFDSYQCIFNFFLRNEFVF